MDHQILTERGIKYDTNKHRNSSESFSEMSSMKHRSSTTPGKVFSIFVLALLSYSTALSFAL